MLAGLQGGGSVTAGPVIADHHLADMGMHIFPVDHPSLPECAGLHKTVPCNGDRGKHPSVAWGHAATTNPKMIATWFSGRTRNVGISCGPSNLVVFDEDEQGVLIAWAADNGITLPPTYVVHTGRGRHFYYRWDHTVTPITNGADKLFGDLKIDVRGYGGFVVGAGSVHQQGRVYEDNGRPIVDLPADLAQRLIAAQNTQQHNGNGTPAPAPGDPNTTPIPKGKRQKQLLKYAGRLRNAGLDLREAENLFRARWELCEQPPGDEYPYPHAKQSVLDDVYNRYQAGTAPGDDASDAEHDADWFREQRVRSELDIQRARREAKRRLDAEERPPIVYPPVTPLTEMLDQPDEAVCYRIDQVAPKQGNIILAAQYKAGKTTLVDNLVRSLVDSDPFLDRFTVHQPAEHLVLIDDEMGRNTLRRWLRDQKIRNTAAVADVITLRGRVSTFNILDDKIRDHWATRLRDLGCDYLILDCLRPILDALGLDENRDVGKFLVAFDALLADAGGLDSFIAQHMGHTGERSRGDSRQLDWPDATWRVVRETEEPDSPRFLSAYGRDVDVHEGRLSFDPRTRRLTYSAGSRGDVKTEAAMLAVVEVLAEHAREDGEDLSGNALEMRAAGGGEHTRTAIRAGIKKAIELKLIETSPGAKRAVLHRLAHPCETCGRPVTGGGFRHLSCPPKGAISADGLP
jgi:hypothetical protein